MFPMTLETKGSQMPALCIVSSFIVVVVTEARACTEQETLYSVGLD